MRGGSWVFLWKFKDYLYGHFESCLSTNGAWGQKLWKIFNSLWAANEPVEYIVWRCLPDSILARPCWGMCLLKRLNTSISAGTLAHWQRLKRVSLIMSCLILQWSPSTLVAWTLSPYLSTLTLPLTTSPILSLHAGEGKERLAAAASLNSALVRLVSTPGPARIQEEESLSLCLHPMTCLSFLGLCCSNALVRRRDPVSILCGTVSPELISCMSVTSPTRAWWMDYPS